MYLLYHTSKDKKKQFHKKNNFKLRYSLCFVLTMAALCKPTQKLKSFICVKKIKTSSS